MKVYVAGRTSEVERVQRVQRLFTDRGHTITFDWTGEEALSDGDIDPMEFTLKAWVADQ